MAVKVSPTSAIFGIATLVLTTLTNTVDAEGLPRDCMLNQVKANSKNPHTFYWCLSDGPVLFHCIDDLVFDTHAKKCISKKQQQKSRDKRGSKVIVTPSSSSQVVQFQKGQKPNAQSRPERPVPQAEPQKKPTSQAQPERPAPQAEPQQKPTAQTQPERPNPQAPPEKKPTAQEPLDKKPAPQVPQDKKPAPQETQDMKSTSPYYYSTLYPFPSRYIPSQPSAPVTAVTQATSNTDTVVHCPIPEYGRDAQLILIPSPDYCDDFYFCANGLPVRFTCPKDTDFNPKLRVCDNVRNMKCVSGKRRRELVKQEESAVP